MAGAKDKQYGQAWVGKTLGPILVDSALPINFRPHPYMVGPKHVEEAADHHCGMLTAEVCEKVKCAHTGCNLGYSEHTCDHVLALKLTRDATATEVAEALKPEADAMAADGVDGFIFVETPEKFRVSQ